MCYSEKIRKIKELMIEEIMDSFEGETILFEPPMEIDEGNEWITEIRCDGTVIAVDDVGNECEGDIEYYDVEKIAMIFDHVDVIKSVIN